MFIKIFFVILTIVILQSCGQDKHTRTYRLPKTQVDTLTHSVISNEEKSSSFSWETPDAWMSAEGSSMRLASFKIPFSTGYGDLSIIELSGDGGGLMANVNRWRDQIGMSPLSRDEIETRAEKMENELGNFTVFRLINPERRESAFLTAILPLHASTLFIKLHASTEGLLEIENDFMSFCFSIKRK